MFGPRHQFQIAKRKCLAADEPSLMTRTSIDSFSVLFGREYQALAEHHRSASRPRLRQWYFDRIEVIALGTHRPGHAEGRLGHDPRWYPAIRVRGAEYKWMCQDHITFFGDHFDCSRPSLLVEDDDQRFIKVIGLKPIGLRLPENARSDVVRALDEQCPTPARIHCRDAKEIEQRFIVRPDVMSKPSSLYVSVVCIERVVEPREVGRKPPHLLGDCPTSRCHQLIHRVVESFGQRVRVRQFFHHLQKPNLRPNPLFRTF